MQLARGNNTQAEDAFKEAVAINPTAIAARLALGGFYWSLRRPADAETQFKAALANDPQHPLANRALAVFYISAGRPSEAEPYLRTLAGALPEGAGKLMLAEYYLMQNKVDAARQPLQEVADSGSKNASAAKLRLAGLAKSSGDRAGALAMVDAVLAKEPTNVEALVARAGWLSENQRLDEALSELKKAKDLNPTAPSVHFALGRLHMLRRERPEAIAAFNQVLTKLPQHALTHLELARLHLNSGQLRDAEQFAQTAVNYAPNSAEARLLLAHLSRVNGNLRTAEESLRVLAAAGPNWPAVESSRGS